MEISDSLKWRGRTIRYAPIILWIAVIFFLSSNQGSMSSTSGIIRPLLGFLFPNTPDETLQIYHGYIRKTAHFTEYAILAFLAVRAFSGASLKLLRKVRFILPVILVAAIAVLDEANQSFESSRTGSVWDVFLDLSGGVAMVLFLCLINLRRKGS